MTEVQLRGRLAAARVALDDADIAFLVAAVPALEAALDAIRAAALDGPAAGWDAASEWTPSVR